MSRGGKLLKSLLVLHITVYDINRINTLQISKLPLCPACKTNYQDKWNFRSLNISWNTLDSCANFFTCI